MKRFFIQVTICSLLLLSPLALVRAVGIGIKPKEINLKAVVNKVTETEMLIVNVSAEAAMYKVTADAFEDIIIISPADFQLSPSSSQIIKIMVRPEKRGLFATNISAIARPMGAGGLSAASGVKVPITISVSGWRFWQLALAVLVICLIVNFVLKLIKDRIIIKIKKD